MTQLLAIDTSGLATRVALANAGELINQKTAHSKRASQSVLSLIDEVLRDSSVSIRQLDAISVVTGPGSFTGLRVGVGVAQGLSLAHGTPLLGISTLALLAKTASMQIEHNCFLVCLEAREFEIYVGRYEIVLGSLNLLGTEFVLNLNGDPTGSAKFSSKECIGVGNGWKLKVPLEEKLGVKPKETLVNVNSSMEGLVKLSLQNIRDIERTDSKLLLPNYVKDQLDYS